MACMLFPRSHGAHRLFCRPTSFSMPLGPLYDTLLYCAISADANAIMEACCHRLAAPDDVCCVVVAQDFVGEVAG